MGVCGLVKEGPLLGEGEGEGEGQPLPVMHAECGLKRRDSVGRRLRANAVQPPPLFGKGSGFVPNPILSN